MLSSYKYQARDILKATLIYCVIAVAMSALSVTSVLVFEGGSVKMNFEMSSIIFCFVMGIVTFSESFYFSIQNATSRKSYFIARVLAVLTGIAALVLMEYVLSLLISLFGSNDEVIRSTSLFDAWKYGAFQDLGNLPKFQSFFAVYMSFFSYLAVYGAGAVINLIFYRLDKMGKAVVGAGAPIALFVLFPMIDQKFFDFGMTKAIGDGIVWLFRETSRFTVFLLIYIVVSFAVAWLLTRRAPVKAK